jgi:hypothetical protein
MDVNRVAYYALSLAMGILFQENIEKVDSI